ncbi:MAG: winged helix-turn-helix transcriptional regulator [Candidatus Thermoplasmatota archaeon]
MQEIDLESRKKIFDFVTSSPGCHMREIQRRLNMPLGTVEYHLRYLTRNELIILKDDGHYKRFYPKSTLASVDKTLLALLRQEIPRKIVMFLLLHPNSSFSKISDDFALSPSTVSFHLEKLVSKNVVKKEKVGRESIYSIVNENETAKILLLHRHSFLDELIDSFVRAWSELHP